MRSRRSWTETEKVGQKRYSSLKVGGVGLALKLSPGPPGRLALRLGVERLALKLGRLCLAQSPQTWSSRFVLLFAFVLLFVFVLVILCIW